MLVFGRKYDEETIYAIYIKKEGKYLYLSKPYDDYDNKEFRMDLTNGQFERINHYKTVETKITPVKVSSITGWFRDCSLFCNDEKFCKVIIYAKHLNENKVQINDYHVNIERSGDMYVFHADIEAVVPADSDLRKVMSSE